ncbi:MAG TPA: LamG-like jellyroll fold domain-containing protein [Phycisphaerales bacterium]|nr:LamG-like jellyroll fold domain-containing protein [Phycisphaerales bacterium]
MRRCVLALVATAPLLGPLTFASAAPPEYHQAVTTAGPLLAYRFDEPSGNIVNYGSYGAGYNAQAFGTVGRSVESPGGDTGVEVGEGDYLESLGASTLTGNPTFSIEAVVWLEEPGSASLWGTFLHWGDATGNRTGKEVYFGIQANDNRRLYAGFYNAGIRSQGRALANRWLHIVWTRVGGNNSEAGSTLYVNGYAMPIERDTQLNPGFLTAGQISIPSTNFRINAGRDFNRYFTGKLDELALYDRVLTPAEIAERSAMVSCRADFDGSGFVDTDDFDAFVYAFEEGDENTDFDGSGFVDTDDFTAFVLTFETGC